MGSVRVLRAGVDLELLELLTAKGVLREHSCNCLLHGLLRLGGKQLGVRGSLQTARETRVAVCKLLLALASSQRNLVSVDDDDVIATISVGREGGLVLPTEQGGDLAGQAAEDDVGGVDDVPRLLDVARLRCVRAHDGLHFFGVAGGRGHSRADVPWSW